MAEKERKKRKKKERKNKEKKRKRKEKKKKKGKKMLKYETQLALNPDKSCRGVPVYRRQVKIETI